MIAPNGPLSAVSGAAITDWIPMRREVPVDAPQSREARVVDVVAGPERPPGQDRLAGDAVVECPVLGVDLDPEARVERARRVGAERAGRSPGR